MTPSPISTEQQSLRDIDPGFYESYRLLLDLIYNAGRLHKDHYKLKDQVDTYILNLLCRTSNKTDVSTEQEGELEFMYLGGKLSTALGLHHLNPDGSYLHKVDEMDVQSAANELYAWHQSAITKAVEAARESTEKIYEREIKTLRAFQESVVRREQLKTNKHILEIPGPGLAKYIEFSTAEDAEKAMSLMRALNSQLTASQQKEEK
jgi:hypothetical protein